MLMSDVAHERSVPTNFYTSLFIKNSCIVADCITSLLTHPSFPPTPSLNNHVSCVGTMLVNAHLKQVF